MIIILVIMLIHKKIPGGLCKCPLWLFTKNLLFTVFGIYFLFLIYVYMWITLHVWPL